MDKATIITLLKVYQGSEGKPDVLADLTDRFVSALHPRIKEEFGVSAEHALKRVLKEMFATPVRPLLCLDAMLRLCDEAVAQFCRDDQWEFEIAEDCNLIQRIKNETYFVSYIPLVERTTVHQSER